MDKTNRFIEKARRIHGDRYDYSKVDYVRATAKVRVICKEHGEFEQTAQQHLAGSGCATCAIARRSGLSRSNATLFIAQAREKHGGRYGYEGVVYVNSQTKVALTCPDHGTFYATPAKHLSGTGCPHCGYILGGIRGRISRDTFLERARAHWGDTYDYTNTRFEMASTPVEIHCRIHGTFKQSPLKHMRGQGCGKCGKLRTAKSKELSPEEFFARCVARFGDTYDYTEAVYTGIHNKIRVRCREHGVFEQQANSHARGSGCPLCRDARQSDARRHTQGKFIEKARAKHGDRYGYDKVAYSGDGNKVEVVCPVHGPFTQEASAHLQGHGCTACVRGTPNKQREIAAYIHDLGFTTKTNDRTVIAPKEIDILVPERALAIELNGVYWHSLTASSPSAEKATHKFKFERCKAAGLSLLQITDLEWGEPATQSIWKSIIASRLGRHTKRIFARNTVPSVISRDEANYFLAEHHLQGPTLAASSSFGLREGGELVAVMTFARHERESLNLTRLAFPTDVTVVGGARKLFRFSLKHLPALPIVTFSDNRYSNGNVYPILGFTFDTDLPPSYQWWFRNELWNKRRCRHKHLPKLLGDLYDPTLTEHENMFRAGARCLYDAGYQRWVYAQ